MKKGTKTTTIRVRLQRERGHERENYRGRRFGWNESEKKKDGCMKRWKQRDRLFQFIKAVTALLRQNQNQIAP